jgi:CRISPR system Cascade subunit CasC
MFVELHMLQSFAPSNLNRDDTNNPKDCEFGGHRRARISSQCLKRAIRRSPIFAQTTGVEIATRTKWLTRLLRAPLLAAGKATEQVDLVVNAFVDHYIGDLEKGRTAIAVYLSNEEAQDMAAALLDNWAALVQDLQPPSGQKAKKPAIFDSLGKRLVKKSAQGTSAPDIALFGRMLTAQPELNMEAACQVAHAISTHRVTMEMDFFTAVDDLLERDEPGAGMMGFTGFDSACFYRYARVDWAELVTNLRGEVELARRAVAGFLRAAVCAVPTGKQSSMAAHNPPDVILAVVRREGMGWSLVNAFEKPVRAAADSGLVAPSLQALDGYWGRLVDTYGADTLAAALMVTLDGDPPLEHLAGYRVANLATLVDGVLAALPAGEAAA